jgi:hypothetical protein
MPRISKVNKLTRANSIISGLSKHFALRTRRRIAGKRYSQREMVAVFQAHLDAIRGVDAARIALSVAVKKEQALARRVKALTEELRSFIANEYGERPDVLADFGWRLPRKPGPQTVAAKLAGVEKRRLARRT